MTRKGAKGRELTEGQGALVLFGVLAFMVLVGMFVAGNAAVRAAAIWIGSLGLLVVVVAAIVGTTSASWTAGRRVAASAIPSPSMPAAPKDGKQSEVVESNAGVDVATALTSLASLYREGALTAEEFEAAKRHLLGSESSRRTV
jgi:Short C-terminal domain